MNTLTKLLVACAVLAAVTLNHENAKYQRTEQAGYVHTNVAASMMKKLIGSIERTRLGVEAVVQR